MQLQIINTIKYFLSNASGDGVLTIALKAAATKEINQSTINQVKDMIADNKPAMLEIIGRDGVHFFNTLKYIPMQLQIDVMEAMQQNIIRCRLTVDGRDVRMFISKDDYNQLITDGFFVRDGKEADSAGCINTTKVFEEKKYSY